ncbi:MAG: hypothetical protein EOT05_04210 [Candidatus Microsaccharimonas sossegonensis]|uniref:Uncharacterized protein n=1 Tax=Candidatus Microsaccharimonas sossegonensis TaxID=2506948 RepID=A0A4V1J7J6_9BACT|nr:MAG: hypothetical protein EOT05_04210 [Candidatus Microsaccharimonas sossegonensis]
MSHPEYSHQPATRRRSIKKKLLKLALAAFIVFIVLFILLIVVIVVIIFIVNAILGQANTSIGQVLSTIFTTLWNAVGQFVQALLKQILANPLQFLNGGGGN